MNGKIDATIQILKETAFFAAAPHEVVVALMNKLTPLHLQPDQLLFQEGDGGDALYLIVCGRVKVFTRNALGEVTVLQQLGPGAHFGEMALIDQRPRSASVMAIDAVTLLVLTRADFQGVIAQHPVLALTLMQDMAAKLRATTAYVHKTNQSTAPSLRPEAGSVQQQGRVFISYARKDVDFVYQLYEGLTHSGIETWIDLKGLPPASDWWAEIERAIQSADAYLFILSPDSLESALCQKERSIAANANKRVIPIFYRAFSQQIVLPEMLARPHWVFMRTPAEMEQSLPDLVRAINTDLAWVHLHTLLLTRAIEWDRSRRDPSYTLRGIALERAERWLAEHSAGREPQPTRLHLDFIQASRQRVTEYA
jgi:CRP-like cAMP-binding protein